MHILDSTIATMLTAAVGVGFAAIVFCGLAVLVIEYVDERKAEKAYRKRCGGAP